MTIEKAEAETEVGQDAQQQPNPFTSRYVIGQIVYFQPHLDLVEFRDGANFDMNGTAVRAKVVGVKFVSHHVLYDLVLADPSAADGDDDGFHSEYPLCNVDSVFLVERSAGEADTDPDGDETGG